MSDILCSTPAGTTAETVDLCLITFELEERNALALTRWRLKMAQDPVYPDACLPVERLLYCRWYDMRRDLARRWLFKRRAERRLEALPGWADALLNDPYAKLVRRCLIPARVTS